MKKFFLPVVSVVAIIFILGGCATSKKVHVAQAGDNNLSCSQLQVELEKLNQAEQEVDFKKGVRLELNLA